MLIYLLRHGETDWNIEHRLQGREDIPLNASGVAQARAATAMFDNIKLDNILSSPLSRAYKTAEIISEYTGTAITVEPDLIERDFGSLSGVVHLGKNIYRLTEETPGVEPINDVAQRVLGVINRYPLTSSILIVSHGGAINATLNYAAGDDPTPGHTKLENTCLSCIEYNGENYNILFFNKTV